MPVFTFGPIVADLAALADPTQGAVRLGRTLGFEWLVSLRSIGLPGSPNPHSRSSSASAAPSDPEPIPTLTASVPANSCDEDLVRSRTRSSRSSSPAKPGDSKTSALCSEPLLGPLLATAGGKPTLGHRQRRRAAELLNALDSPTRVRRLYNQESKASLYCLAPATLYARALLELIELYNDTPPLAICARCNFLFVTQRKGDRHCRRYIWPAQGGENIAGCLYDHNQTPTRARLESDARRRESKKLQMRVSRLTHDLGHNHATTRRAQSRVRTMETRSPRRPRTASDAGCPHPTCSRTHATDEPRPTRPAWDRQGRCDESKGSIRVVPDGVAATTAGQARTHELHRFCRRRRRPDAPFRRGRDCGRRPTRRLPRRPRRRARGRDGAVQLASPR